MTAQNRDFNLPKLKSCKVVLIDVYNGNKTNSTVKLSTPRIDIDHTSGCVEFRGCVQRDGLASSCDKNEENRDMSKTYGDTQTDVSGSTDQLNGERCLATRSAECCNRSCVVVKQEEADSSEPQTPVSNDGVAVNEDYLYVVKAEGGSSHGSRQLCGVIATDRRDSKEELNSATDDTQPCVTEQGEGDTQDEVDEDYWYVSEVRESLANDDISDTYCYVTEAGNSVSNVDTHERVCSSNERGECSNANETAHDGPVDDCRSQEKSLQHDRDSDATIGYDSDHDSKSAYDEATTITTFTGLIDGSKGRGHIAKTAEYESNETTEPGVACNIGEEQLSNPSSSSVNVASYVCLICDKSFAKRVMLTRHKRTTKCKSGMKREGIPGKRHVCSTCGKCFSRPSWRDIHQNYHTREKRYPCSICDKVYFIPRSLSHHERTHRMTYKNLKKRSYLCETCGKSFSSSTSVTVHQQSHHMVEKAFTCSSCDKWFGSLGRLKSHEQVHTGARDHICDTCGKSFHCKSSLSAHKSRTHSVLQMRVVCPICDRTFNNKWGMKSHMRCHTGEKPHACHVCGTSFSQPSALQDHLRIHTNSKPYSCHACGKKFVTVSQVKTHEKSHSSEKPYSCRVCDKSFRLPHHFRAHEKTHENDTKK